MSLAEVFEEVAQRRRPHHQLCSFVKVRDRLDDDDAAFVDRLMADEDVLGKDIAATLTRAGHEIKAEPVRRHRRGDCTCGTR